ncbi:SDR family NAD(P)-dependent oxidoreductase [Saccharicrinis sp. FJH62]|uniref:SDR family NAD(P)-dependent oxidoreductase n=1 Tax=Saccharicrinis sp. FJH62 TaxID=3344657 RepID=UPI0035D4B11E
MKVKDKVIVVTGGGNGMGREIVLNLLKKGAKVAAVDINEPALEQTQTLAGDLAGNLSIHVLNITNKAEVEAFPEIVIQKHGTVDGLINNAGIIQPFEKVNIIGYDIIERVMNIDFYGTLFMVKAFLPYLLKQPEGHIANISSMGGFLPVPGQSIYGAAKAGVKIMTEGLSKELSNTNVHTTVIFPGAIATDIKVNSGAEEAGENDDKAKNSLIKPLLPSKAAEIIISAIEKNKQRVFVGNDSKVMDALYRINPMFAASLIAKQMKSHVPD